MIKDDPSEHAKKNYRFTFEKIEDNLFKIKND